MDSLFSFFDQFFPDKPRKTAKCLRIPSPDPCPHPRVNTATSHWRSGDRNSREQESRDSREQERRDPRKAGIPGKQGFQGEIEQGFQESRNCEPPGANTAPPSAPFHPSQIPKDPSEELSPRKSSPSPLHPLSSLTQLLPTKPFPCLTVSFTAPFF